MNRFQTVIAGLMAMVFTMVSGCGSSEPVIQIHNLRYVQLLHTAISYRDPTKVDKVISSAHQQRQLGTLDDQELSVLMEIGLMAMDKKWEQAEQACRRLEGGQQWRRRS